MAIDDAIAYFYEVTMKLDPLVRDFIAKQRVGHFATSDENALPQVVPVSFVEICLSSEYFALNVFVVESYPFLQ